MKPGGMKEKRPESLGRDGRLRRFQRSVNRRLREVRGLRGVAVNGSVSRREKGFESLIDADLRRANRR